MFHDVFGIKCIMFVARLVNSRSITLNSMAFPTVAAAFVVGEHEARLARALETARRVGAGAKLANVGLHLALVDIWEGKQAEIRCN